MICSTPLFHERLLRKRFLHACFFTLLFLLSMGAPATVRAAEEELAGTSFDIVSSVPAPSAFNGVTVDTTVQATFNSAVNAATLADNFILHGSQQGEIAGSFGYDNGTNTTTFTPTQSFFVGEQVTVIGTAGVRSQSGTALTPHQWDFMTGHIDTTRCVKGFLAYEDDFTGVWASATDWGDFDRDGDLDAVVVGKTVGDPISYLYRNDGIDQETGMSGFTAMNVGLRGVREASVAWGDYNNDGYLDILLTGTDVTGQKVSNIYQNNAGVSFTNINANLTPVSLGGGSWVDYNSDGLLDLFLHGDSNGGRLSRLYRNDGSGTFTVVATTLPGVNNSSVDWNDYDHDGDPDLLLTGDSVGGFIAHLYRNDNGTFVNSNAGLPGVRDSAVAWGDYNDDGFSDILLSGETSSGASAPVTRIYRNQGNGSFVDINAGLGGILDGSVAWGDFDNDGDLDILAGGKDAAEEVSTTLYENQGGAFVIFPTDLPAISLGSLAFGDADGDRDVDILLTGLTDTNIVAGVYRNYDCPADLQLTQSLVPTQVTASAPVTITLDFTNLGPVTATEVVIEDVVPAALVGLQVISSTTAGHIQITESGNQPPYQWNVSNLEVGDGGTITITGLLFPQPGQVYTNTARIRSVKDVTMTNNVASQQVSVPFRVLQTTPEDADAASVPLDQQLSIGFEASIEPNTVDAQSLRLYGSQSGALGLANPAYNGGAQTYEFHADRSFVTGETVTVIGTDAIRSPAGAALVPHQWQFTANHEASRCVGDFVQRGFALPGLENGAVAWGDFDNDGDDDLLLAGASGTGPISRIYRNDGNQHFVDINAALTGIRNGSAHWIDHDGDGDLDLFLHGSNGATRVANFYRNTNGIFNLFSSGITPVQNSMAAWGDYNNDGYLDLLLAGNAASGRIAAIYRNNGDDTFTDINAGLVGVENGAVAWADVDGDHDLDLLLTGNNGAGPFTILYHNEDGSFTDSQINLADVENSTVAWSDYDLDGDLDLLLAGNSNSGAVTKLYANSTGNLAEVVTTLPAIHHGSAAWGDYDNDGNPDLLLTGTGNSGPVTAVYRQQGGTFTAFATTALAAVGNSAASWGDYDRDNDLDLVLLGNGGSGTLTRVHRNMECVSDVAIAAHVMPAAAEAGETITYTFTFSNAGPQVARSVSINAPIPEDLTNVQTTNRAIGAGTVITPGGTATTKVWQVSDLAVDAGGVITLTATVAAGVPGGTFGSSVAVAATHDITLTNNSASAIVGRPFHVTTTDPQPGANDFAPTGSIRASVDAAVDPASLTAQSVRVYGEQSGWRNAVLTYNAGERQVQAAPTTPFHLGETVHVVATAALRTTLGAPLQPHQWHFNTGLSNPDYCVADFEAQSTSIVPLSRGSADWGDYDGDGDLDLLLTGTTDGTTPTTKLYRNDGNGTFVDLSTTLAAVHSGAAAWGDYDGDGDLDVALTGNSAGGAITRLYQNNGGAFTDVNATLTGVRNSALAWGDYDNDGDLDLLLTGTIDGNNGLTQLYRNEGGTFVAQSSGFANVHSGSAMWGDADNDGKLDLLLSGTTNGTAVTTQIYWNDGDRGFVNSGLTLAGIKNGQAIWGDQSNDGYLDLFLAGQSAGGARVARLYQNNGNRGLTDVTGSNAFAAVDQASMAWGDYDLDGDLDLLLTGTTDGTTPISQVLTNQGSNRFVPEHLPTAVYAGMAAWADYDGDLELELLVTGRTASGTAGALHRSRPCTSDLSLAKSASASTIVPGETVSYTLRIENNGPDMARQVVITDLIPVAQLTNLSVQSSVPYTQQGSTPYVLQLPNIPAGQGATIVIQGEATQAAMGSTIVNSASVAAQADVLPANNADTATVSVRTPTVNFAIIEQSIAEDGGNATIQVTLDLPNLAGAVTVNYQSSGGTAQSGADYTAVNAQLSIPAGQTTATFVVPVLEDQLDEEDETVLLTLSNAQGAQLGQQTQLTLTITDNDPLPILIASGVTVDETAGEMNFTFELSTASGRPVTLLLNTIDGTATAPEDYVALVNQNVVIEPGTTRVTVPVTIVDNATQEGEEHFSLGVTPTNATMANTQATGTIRDNDNHSIFLPIVNK